MGVDGAAVLMSILASNNRAGLIVDGAEYPVRPNQTVLGSLPLIGQLPSNLDGIDVGFDRASIEAAFLEAEQPPAVFVLALLNAEDISDLWGQLAVFSNFEHRAVPGDHDAAALSIWITGWDTIARTGRAYEVDQGFAFICHITDNRKTPEDLQAEFGTILRAAPRP